MRPKIALIYNEPAPGRYSGLGEQKAVVGVMDAVQAVHQALIELGYPVELVPLSPPLERAEETLKSLDADLIFNLFEGFADSPKTEASVANMLAALGKPYTGCSGAMLALGLDKARTKALLAANGIDTPRCQVLTPETLPTFNLSFPCIVKPAGEDASHGLTQDSVVHDRAALARQVIKISQLYGGQALVEEYVDGREFNITILGIRKPVALPISEIVFSLPPGLPRILTFDAKWEEQSPYFDGTKAVCPAEIDDELKERISETARRVFRLLCDSGYARVDFRMDRQGQLQVIEVNPNPDISPDTGAARQAKASGMTYSQFTEKLVQLAIERVEMGLKIRSMTGKDKAAVMRILNGTPEFKPSEVPVAEELIDCYLNDPSASGYFVLVAETGRTVDGYVCFGPTPLTEGTWDIYWIAVARELQGRGIGRALMTAAEDKIRGEKGRLILVETSSTPEYEKTRRFYQSSGYQLIAQIPDFYAPGDDVVIFQRRLG